MFPTSMFETATQRKILRVLAEQNRKYTSEELSEMCQRSESSVSRALKNVERYPFIQKDNIPGSKELTYQLNPESGYTEPIKEFFRIERRRERKNGTIPVQVWNILEDVSTKTQKKVDEFIELFLFGSYATGNYYAGSDIDLLLVHDSDEDVSSTVEQTYSSIKTDREIQVIEVKINENYLKKDKTKDKIYESAPVRGIDTLISLTGNIET